jgi:hypothetical protein
MNGKHDQLKNLIKDLALKGVAGIAINELTNILDQAVHQAAKHAGALIQAPHLFQFYSIGLMPHINSPSRGSTKHQVAQHAGVIIQSSHLFQFYGCAFIHYINRPNRGGKRVDLLHENWDGSLVDEKWINGALQTTALRKRPKSIPKQKGRLGYSKGKSLAVNHAKKFLDDLKSSAPDHYSSILLKHCESLKEAMESLGLFWTFGRSQKFFNILTKYWFVVANAYPDRLESRDLALVKKLSDSLHAPIDSITLNHIRRFKDPAEYLNIENVYWGWNMDLKEYLVIQKFLDSLAKEKNMPKIAYELIEVWQLSAQIE